MWKPRKTVGQMVEEAKARIENLSIAQVEGEMSRGDVQVLDIRDSGQPPCVHVTGLIARRLGEVEARLAELTRARDQLVVLAARAAEQDPADCRGYCSIIAG